MRAVLILTASEPQPLSPALDSGASALLLRLGESVESAARRAARRRARDFLRRAKRRDTRPTLFLQLPPLGGEALELDLDAMTDAPPDGVFLEACEGRADVQRLSVKLAVFEARAGVAEGSTKIVALAAQTAAGLFRLGDYARASARLAALAFDETAPPGGPEAEGVARSLLVLGAAAAGVPALAAAPPGAEPDDASSFHEGCAALRRQGFAGLITHRRSQVAAIEAGFGPA
jgi:citrate lyase subunit beta/citryl-CoA lyase